MELFSIRIQRTFQLVSTPDLQHFRINLALRFVKSTKVSSWHESRQLSATICVCPAYAGHTPKAFQIVQKYKFSFTNQVFGVLFFQRVQVPYERIETPNR